MQTFILSQFSLLAAVAAQQYLPTAALANNAPQASSYAFLPFAGQDSSIKGRFDFQSQLNGTTAVTFSLSDLSSNLSFPLSYFISDTGVPTNGDCYLAGPIFDPAGSLSYCNPQYPQACKVGDLSGKHTNITQNSTGGDYYDNFISFSSASTEYFANRAIVLLDSNNTRLACTNITLVSSGNGTSSSNATSSPVTYADVYDYTETSANSTTNGTSANGTATSGGATRSGTSSARSSGSSSSLSSSSSSSSGSPELLLSCSTLVMMACAGLALLY